MSDEKLKLWLGFAKFFLGTFALGLVTTLINASFQERELELREQDQIGQFLAHALDQDVGVRRRFAQYFSTVTRSEKLRERWTAYLALVGEEFAETSKEKDQLEKQLETVSLGETEKRTLLTKIAELEQALSPKLPVSPETVEPRIYFHIQSEPQRKSAKGLAERLRTAAYIVPGIQLVESGPSRTQLRYFRIKEEDEAASIAEAIRTSGQDVFLEYIRGFETSTLIRPRHYELWYGESK